MEHYEEIINNLSSYLETIYADSELQGASPVRDLVLGLFRAHAEMNIYGIVPDLKALYELALKMSERVFSFLCYSMNSVDRQQQNQRVRDLTDAVALILCTLSGGIEKEAESSCNEYPLFDLDDEDLPF